jgi:hypothetical protein
VKSIDQQQKIKTCGNMRLPQAALVPVTAPIEAMNTSSRNKITKGGLRQAQARYLQLKTTEQ